jgi:serine phosphatase RsbU (regulator of sigma subunit)
MSGPDEDLRERLRVLRAFGALRRALRAADGLEEVAAQAVRFAAMELGASRCAVLAAERDDADFALLADSASGAAAGTVPRTTPFIARLEGRALAFDGQGGAEAIGWSGGGHAVPCRHGDRLVGAILLSAAPIDAESLEELGSEVGYALQAASAARNRAEELAVLEVQERELVSLLRDVQERDAIIRSDLEEARAFQHMMLGGAPRVPGVIVEVFYRPLDLVGGDLYALSYENGVLRVFVADATGHGVRASLTTMFIKAGYEAVKAHARDPAALLVSLNDAIARRYASAEMLFSAACLDLEIETGVVRYASAGHPPLCVVRDGKAETVEGGQALLGLRPRMQFSAAELRVSRRDGLYLLTDGLPEAREPSGEILGDERLHAAIAAAHASGGSVVTSAVAAVEAFTKSAKLRDDATLVGVRFGEADPPVSLRSTLF